MKGFIFWRLGNRYSLFQCFIEKQNPNNFYLNAVCHFDFVTPVPTAQELNIEKKE